MLRGKNLPGVGRGGGRRETGGKVKLRKRHDELIGTFCRGEGWGLLLGAKYDVLCRIIGNNPASLGHISPVVSGTT